MKTNKEYLQEKFIEELDEEPSGATFTINGIEQTCSQCESTSIRLVKNNINYCFKHAKDQK